MPKLFSFRFDVDTHRCVREGMPALVALGARLDAPFTFFVNMGRAVSLRQTLAGSRSAGVRREAAKYSARRKLGWRGYVEAALLNPEVGRGAVEVIRAAHAAGHEVGLHGGLNHADWQANAGRWDRGRIEREIDAVLPSLLQAIEGTTPAGFASPGWTTSPELGVVLEARGFRYMADLHGPTESRAASNTPDRQGASHDLNIPGLPNVYTTLTGEPGGVAYLEHLRASGLNDAAFVERFERDLERSGPSAVVYDHPYYAGLKELSMVQRMVEIARSSGYDVVPLAVLAGVQPA